MRAKLLKKHRKGKFIEYNKKTKGTDLDMDII